MKATAAAPTCEGLTSGGPSSDKIVKILARTLRSTVAAVRRSTVSATTSISLIKRSRFVSAAGLKKIAAEPDGHEREQDDDDGSRRDVAKPLGVKPRGDHVVRRSKGIRETFQLPDPCDSVSSMK